MVQRNSALGSGSNQKTTSDKRRNSITSNTILDTLKQTIAEYYPVEQKNKLHNYINGRFIDQVLYFETHEDVNSRYYTRIKVALVVLAASTSLSVGLEAIFSTSSALSTALKIIALVLTLLVTVCSTILTTFNFQAKSLALQQYREINHPVLPIPSTDSPL